MIAVNPKSTKTVKIGGVEFTIGIIPYAKKLEIEAMGYVRRGGVLTAEDALSILRQSYEYARWGVKGHSGLKFSDGSDVPFTTEMDGIEGRDYSVVSKETMEIYGATLEEKEVEVDGKKQGVPVSIITLLASEVSSLNYLKAEVAKN